jgi:uncharacterized protein YkwD
MFAVVFVSGIVMSPVAATQPTAPGKNKTCIALEKKLAKLVKRDAPSKKITVAAKNARKTCGADLKPAVTLTPAAVSIPKGWQGHMLAQLNQLRAGAGVRTLTLCAPIEAAAQDYSTVMTKTGHYDHQGPDGRLPWDRMKAAGYQYQSAAENIAMGYGDVEAVMQAWIDSPAHYSNLVEPGFVHVGFGKNVSDDGDTYWVQNFGSGGTC